MLYEIVASFWRRFISLSALVYLGAFFHVDKIGSAFLNNQIPTLRFSGFAMAFPGTSPLTALCALAIGAAIAMLTGSLLSFIFRRRDLS